MNLEDLVISKYLFYVSKAKIQLESYRLGSSPKMRLESLARRMGVFILYSNQEILNLAHLLSKYMHINVGF